ncbi:hypothetical protein [Massilia sp. CCM 8734]|uniref:hypothetical protein n=1 Tax=Massilia sp. CCM 8734 TaxID=2609283 RepID=UPI001421041E|nr:hypothetical protein [Massilia sp. CCM 8734]NHZ99625.1 hypothetical protein [Massilia sp. CCM 8734]
MIEFKISRFDKDEMAHVCDMGDLEFVFDGERISTTSDSRLLNMVYLSVVELIYCLDKLSKGAKRCKFIAADSSFGLVFEQKKKQSIFCLGRRNLGPFSWVKF